MREQAEGQIKRDQEFPAPASPLPGPWVHLSAPASADGIGPWWQPGPAEGHRQGAGWGPATAFPLHSRVMLPCSIYLLSSCPASPTAHTDRECQGFHPLAPKKIGSHSAELQINNLGAQRLFARAPCLWQPPASSSHLLSHLLWVGETGDSFEQSRGSIMK